MDGNIFLIYEVITMAKPSDSTIEEFDINCLDRSTVNTDTCLKHHEHTESAQVTFAKEVRAVVREMEDMGNQFTEDSGDLLVLDTRYVADPAVVETVRMIEKTGQ